MKQKYSRFVWVVVMVVVYFYLFSSYISDSKDISLPNTKTAAGIAENMRLLKVHRKKSKEIAYQIEETLFPWIKPGFKSINDIPRKKSGYGMVVCVNDFYTPLAWTLIKTIRTMLNNTIAIEAFYIGPEELSVSNRRMLESLENVKTKDILHYFEDVEIKDWAIKPFAMLASFFRHVLLVDADVLFFQDPQLLFSFPEYFKTQTLFFYDRTLKHTMERMKTSREFLNSVLPHPIPRHVLNKRIFKQTSFHEQESGVVVMDTIKHVLPLLTICLLNSKVKQETYTFFYGDKETFWIGFDILSVPYSFHPIYPGQSGEHLAGNKICSGQMVHVDHRHNPLWINGGLQENKNSLDIHLSRHTSFVLEPGEWEVNGGFGCLTSTTPPIEYTKKNNENI
jgi:hypothetical protein